MSRHIFVLSYQQDPNEKGFCPPPRLTAPTLPSGAYYLIEQLLQWWLRYSSEASSSKVYLEGTQTTRAVRTDITDSFKAFCTKIDRLYPMKNYWSRIADILQENPDSNSARVFYQTLHWPRNFDPRNLSQQGSLFSVINYKGNAISSIYKLPIHVNDFTGLKVSDANLFDILSELKLRALDLKESIGDTDLSEIDEQILEILETAIGMYTTIEKLATQFFQGHLPNKSDLFEVVLQRRASERSNVTDQLAHSNLRGICDEDYLKHLFSDAKSPVSVRLPQVQYERDVRYGQDYGQTQPHPRGQQQPRSQQQLRSQLHPQSNRYYGYERLFLENSSRRVVSEQSRADLSSKWRNCG